MPCPPRYDPIVPRAWIVALSSSLGFAAVLGGAPRDRTAPAPKAEAGVKDEKHAWPDPAARLTPPTAIFPARFGVRRVFLDPGHGADGNKGNVSSLCEDEQDFTLLVARHLAQALAATGRFEARLGRDGGVVSYADRVKLAEAWGADAFISVHSDVRGAARPWAAGDGQVCLRSDEAPGFAVLVSDEGPESVVLERQVLANTLAAEMLTAGFPLYGGAEYVGAYEPLADVPGVFLDRHAADKRIFVLRKTAMPAVLVETHNALHAGEAFRWRDPATLEAFDAAVVAALALFFAK
jgi:N-acetylmuramoyl-L-alanine amidase